MRRIAPLRRTGSPAGRRSDCARSAPPSAPGGRWLPPTAHGRVAAGVLRLARLSVVRERVARAVTAAHVESTVGPKVEIADRVARELLAPAIEEHLRPGGDVAVCSQAHQAPAHHAPVGLRPRRGRAVVSPRRRVSANRGIARVERVDVRSDREVRVERQPEEPAVAGHRHFGGQVGEDRGRPAEARVDLDEPALLGDEDSTVRSEAHRGRERQARYDGRLLEALRKRRCGTASGWGYEGGNRDDGDKAPAHRTGLPAFRLAFKLADWLVEPANADPAGDQHPQVARSLG